MNVVFAGTPAFSLPSLEALLVHPNIDVVAVYTQPDRPAGRGKKLTASPVKQLALDHNLKVVQPTSFKSASEIDALARLEPDLIVVSAYGLILPPDVLSIPKLGCINVHASLLPRWRGAAPIQRAIEAGDQITGITLMKMEAGLDTGPMLSRVEIPIAETETGGSLHDKLSAAGGALLSDSLDPILAGTLPAMPQQDQLASYARKLSREETKIDWQQSAACLDRKIRAFNPWPMARTMLRGNGLRLLQTRLEPDTSENNKPVEGENPLQQAGEILTATRAGIRVKTGRGNLMITHLQKSGGKPMDAQAFLNGVKLIPGERFG